ncbi:MAG: proline reductase-associated electron transfer protein PrdC, partial [Clostridia bacterium]|nr:proline reductase-associated electron transfer protein PrdC [Clostridia bacterium]
MNQIKILLKQHIGAPCAPVVAVGDKVKKGTLLAQPTGLGANIFSSVFGEVAEITENHVVINADEVQPDEYEMISGETNLELVKNAGIVGMGGAGFPTAVKLNTDLNGGYILINAAECEPGLLHNIHQLETQTDKTVRGVKYCMEISNAAKAIFAIKAKNEKAVKAVKEAIKNEENMSVFLMPDIYPMGEERAVV